MLEPLVLQLKVEISWFYLAPLCHGTHDCACCPCVGGYHNVVVSASTANAPARVYAAFPLCQLHLHQISQTSSRFSSGRNRSGLWAKSVREVGVCYKWKGVWPVSNPTHNQGLSRQMLECDSFSLYTSSKWRRDLFGIFYELWYGTSRRRWAVSLFLESNGPAR